MDTPDKYIPSVVSIKQMANLLGISRSRLYQLIDAGIFLKPVYLLSNKRPYFTQKMARSNLKVKEEGVGINGEVVLFYGKRDKAGPASVKHPAPRRKPNRKTDKKDYADLKDALESLGMLDLTDRQIASALTVCFPDGARDVDEGDVIITVFRHLKEHNSADNVGR